MGGRQPGAGREGYHNITNHRRRDVSIQLLTLVRIRALLALISTTALVLPSSHSPPLLSPASFSRRDSRTRYLSSPRAIRTNGRIRQLSRYTPPPPSLKPSRARPSRSPSRFSSVAAFSSSSICDPTASGSSSSPVPRALSLGLRCVLRVYDPVENVRPHPRHDLALVSTPNGSRRSTRILA